MSVHKFFYDSIHSIADPAVRKWVSSLIPGFSQPEGPKQVAALPQLNCKTCSAAPAPHDASRAVRTKSASPDLLAK